MTDGKADGKGRGRKAKGATRGAKQRGPTKADIESFLDLVALRRKPRCATRVLPGTKLRLRFSEEERRLILDNCSMAGGLSAKQLKALEKSKQPSLSLSLSDWDDFGGWVAATGNHARDGSKLQRSTDALSDRIQGLLESFTEE